jgi:hypothetical protein
MRMCEKQVTHRSAHFHDVSSFPTTSPLPSVQLSSKEALISSDDAGDAAKDLQKKDQPSSGV